MTGDVRIDAVLVSRYPCCKGPVRLTAHHDRTRERYRRTCRRCGREWSVERVQVKGPGVSLGGADRFLGTRPHIDRLDFREVVAKPGLLERLAWRVLAPLGFRARRFARFRRVYL